MSANIVCQQIYDADADFDNFFCGGTNFSDADPAGVGAKVKLNMTGNISALLTDLNFRAVFSPPDATAPSQLHFQGASDAFLKVHAQLHNGALVSSTAAVDGSGNTYTYETEYPDGDKHAQTSWNSAWGAIVGYALDSSDTNGALIKAQAINDQVKAPVPDAANPPALLAGMYGPFTTDFNNGAIGAAANVNANAHFWSACMSYLYEQYGDDTSADNNLTDSRLANDVSQDTGTKIALKPGDSIAWWVKVTPAGTIPAGQDTQMVHIRFQLTETPAQ